MSRTTTTRVLLHHTEENIEETQEEAKDKDFRDGFKMVQNKLREIIRPDTIQLVLRDQEEIRETSVKEAHLEEDKVRNLVTVVHQVGGIQSEGELDLKVDHLQETITRPQEVNLHSRKLLITEGS